MAQSEARLWVLEPGLDFPGPTIGFAAPWLGRCWPQLGLSGRLRSRGNPEHWQNQHR